MMKSRWNVALGCLAVLTGSVLMSQSVLAADPIGMVKVMSGGATVSRGGQQIPAKLGMNVFQSDIVSTGGDGRIGLTFADNSMMSLGPNASLSLDKFQFNSTTYVGEFESSLKRGTLAAVSGRIAKQTPEAMSVRTPSAILGVRGTKFLVQVSGE